MRFNKLRNSFKVIVLISMIIFINSNSNSKLTKENKSNIDLDLYKEDKQLTLIVKNPQKILQTHKIHAFYQGNKLQHSKHVWSLLMCIDKEDLGLIDYKYSDPVIAENSKAIFKCKQNEKNTIKLYEYRIPIIAVSEMSKKEAQF